MIVYGELLFIENMIIGGVLLYLTGEICGGANRNGILIGSIMCGAFSLVIFLKPDIPAVSKSAVMLLAEGAFAIAVCTVVFWRKGHCGAMKKVLIKRMQWRHALTFILVTYFMGGVVMGLLLIAKQQGIYTAVGIYTGDMKAAMLAVFISLGYVTIKQIMKTVQNRKLFTEHTYEAEIVIDKHIFRAKAFLDTGNRLKDPVTGKPVAVASEALWHQMMCSASKEDEKSADVRFAAIPYEAVGTKGLLQAVRTDRLEVNGRRIKGCLIARSERQLEIGRYDLLISGEMIR